MSNEFNTDDASIDSIDFVNTKETSESIQQLARELDQAKAEDFMRKSSLSNETMNRSADISEMTDAERPSALKKTKRPPSIRISMLPDSIRETAMELDKNQDGDLSLGE